MKIKIYEDELDCAEELKSIEDNAICDRLIEFVDEVIPVLNKRLPSFSFLAHTEPTNVDVYKHFLQCMKPEYLGVEFYAELSSEISESISFEIWLCKQDSCALTGCNILTNKMIICTGKVSELETMLDQLIKALNDSYVEINGYCFPVPKPSSSSIKRVLI